MAQALGNDKRAQRRSPAPSLFAQERELISLAQAEAFDLGGAAVHGIDEKAA